MLITDSSGLQEEAAAPPIGKPVLIIRLSTERPEAVEASFAKLSGVEKQGILKAIEQTLEKENKLPEISPYGDGAAAQGIVEILKKQFNVLLGLEYVFWSNRIRWFCSRLT